MRESLSEQTSRAPSPKERMNEQGRIILRVSSEVRGFIAAAVEAGDEEAVALARDLDTLDDVGRWLAGSTPISLGVAGASDA